MGIFDRFKKKKEDEAVKAAAVQAAKEAGKVDVKKESPKAEPKKAEAKKDTKAPVARKKRSKPSVSNGVFVRPHVTEKTAQREAKGLYTFEVIASANKYTVADEFEHMFGTRPVAVRMMSRQGKKKRFGRTVGQRKNRKYALVQLEKGKTVSLHKGV